ncbi:hypothetical protein PPACK8108_LOCUS15346 [Phakopsora pachyrhizi]|uniref:Uncharacterized protein n=1 Tax=Phakopsora pachyrhizi TaxID=170000 RepID=A0AAV0B8N7_PHAPC|nr:hypothetical protein PPACK8108_LOCUS15346 [Phakopsora pachyrhizi]
MPRLVQWDVRNFHSLSMNMYHTAITAYILEDMRTRGIIIDKINKTKAPATGIYEVICDYGANGWCTMSHGLCLYRLNAGAWNSGNKLDSIVTESTSSSKYYINSQPLTSVSDQLKRGGEDNWLQWRTIDTSIARIRANILSSQLSSPFTPRKTACTYDL